MKIKFILLVLAIIVSSTLVKAQCQVKKIILHGATISQVDGGYLYNRTETEFHAVAFKTLLVQRQTETKIMEEIKYTTTNGTDEPKMAAIKFSDGEIIILPLLYTGKEITDNKTLNTKLYTCQPDVNTLAKMRLVTIDALGLMGASGEAISMFILTDKAAIKQNLECLTAALLN